MDVKEFDQYWELPPVVLEDILSRYPLYVCLHDLPECVSGEPAVGDHRVDEAHICQFPTFSDMVFLCELHFITVLVAFSELFPEPFDECAASPRLLLRYRNEFYRVKVSFLFHICSFCGRKYTQKPRAMQMRSIRHDHAAATGDLRSHGSGGMVMSERPSGQHCRGVNRVNGRRPNIRRPVCHNCKLPRYFRNSG